MILCYKLLHQYPASSSQIFEKRLLENHASMVEKLILEENPEHIEIEVLGEIEELLSDTSDALQPFLQNILGKNL